MSGVSRALAEAISEGINAAALIVERLDTRTTTEAEARTWLEALQGYGKALDAAPSELARGLGVTRKDIESAEACLSSWIIYRREKWEAVARTTAAKVIPESAIIRPR